MDFQRIIEEDILRILFEEGRDTVPKELYEKIYAPYKGVLKAIDKLTSEKLIEYSLNKSLKLTHEGKVRGKNVFGKHIAIEDYFVNNKAKTKAHDIAHILEHYVSKEVILNLKLIDSYKDQGISLLKITMGYEYYITDIGFDISDDMFERLASMGVYPGKKIIISAVLPNCIVIEIGNKKIAIDKSIAKKIKVY